MSREIVGPNHAVPRAGIESPRTEMTNSRLREWEEREE